MKYIFLIIIMACNYVANAQNLAGKYQLIKTVTKEGITITPTNKDSVMKVLAPKVLRKIEEESKQKLSKKDSVEIMQSGAFYYKNLFEEVIYLTADGFFIKEGLETKTAKVKTLSEGDFVFNNKNQEMIFYGSGSYAYAVDINAVYNSKLGTITCFSDTTDGKPLYIKDVYKKMPNDKRTRILLKLEPDVAKMELQKKYFPADFTSLYIGAPEAYVNKQLPILNNQNSRYGIKKVTRQGRNDIVYLYTFEFKDKLTDAQIDDYLNSRYGTYNNKDAENTWKFETEDGVELIIWRSERSLIICNAKDY